MIGQSGCRFDLSGLQLLNPAPRHGPGSDPDATGAPSPQVGLGPGRPSRHHSTAWGWQPATLLGLLLALLVVVAGPAQALAAANPLVVRQGQWPAWTLPAPLQRPGQGDLVLPEWMLGTWSLQELDPQAPTTSDRRADAGPPDARPDGARSPGKATSASPAAATASVSAGAMTTGPMTNAPVADPPAPIINVRFVANGRGQVVVDRAFNAFNLGRSVLGDSLLAVENDPRNPNRQLARLRGDRLIESTVIGRRRVNLDDASVLADELTLQIVHGPDQPQISRVEVLALYRRQGPDVTVEQWQASYGAPGDSPEARRSSHRLLLLQRPAGGAFNPD